MASTNTETTSTVERLGVEPVGGAPRRLHLLRTPEKIPETIEGHAEPGPVPATPTIEPRDTTAERLAIYRAIASVIAASAAVLATRLILLIAMLGAFTLAVMALQANSWIGFAILIAYAVLILIPIVYLETKTRWQSE